MILSDNESLRLFIIQAVIDKHLRCRVAPLSLFSSDTVFSGKF
ncbi:hypothetical protein F385_3117 [Pantoea agglomerans 299R]|jgi:hypothetical protein|nr:hypothetical protein PanABDRAFT_1074 [Pantoea sp. aB]ELP23821.1 hypothetical protein F385_3117 [Pantoea agglomerans 299R]SJZ47794.1 hypothetical protein SAMN03097723_1110 [Pantoea eucalypti]